MADQGWMQLDVLLVFVHLRLPVFTSTTAYLCWGEKEEECCAELMDLVLANADSTKQLSMKVRVQKVVRVKVLSETGVGWVFIYHSGMCAQGLSQLTEPRGLSNAFAKY